MGRFVRWGLIVAAAIVALGCAWSVASLALRMNGPFRSSALRAGESVALVQDLGRVDIPTGWQGEEQDKIGLPAWSGLAEPAPASPRQTLLLRPVAVDASGEPSAALAVLVGFDRSSWQRLLETTRRESSGTVVALPSGVLSDRASAVFVTTVPYPSGSAHWRTTVIAFVPYDPAPTAIHLAIYQATSTPPPASAVAGYLAAVHLRSATGGP